MQFQEVFGLVEITNKELIAQNQLFGTNTVQYIGRKGLFKIRPLHDDIKKFLC
jgi:hypothetical protein